MTCRYNLVAWLTLLLSGSLLVTQAMAVSPVQELLEPRDLDGDTTTIEAYYDTRQNLTWLADTNIGKSQTFGLVRTSVSIGAQEVHVSGQMRQSALEAYLLGMNQSVYLGLSNWRLPVAQVSGDSTCSIQSSGYSLGLGCSSAELPELKNIVLERYGNISRSPFKNLGNNARWLGSQILGRNHKYKFTETGNLSTGPLATTPAYVWPVHDGDVGNPVFAPACVDNDGDGWGWDGTSSCLAAAPTVTDCIDLDGDGWGWNGSSSCIAAAPTVTDCIDTDGDGWGWNGRQSCQVEPRIVNPVCIDSPPENDGWGWDGTASCRLPVGGEGDCEDHGSYPSGWNPVTSESCRLDKNSNQRLITSIEDQRAIWQTYNNGSYEFLYSILPYGFTGEGGCPIVDLLPQVTISVLNNTVTQVTDIYSNPPLEFSPDNYDTIDEIFKRMLNSVDDIDGTPTFSAIGGYPASYRVYSKIESCPDSGIEYQMTLCTDAFIQTDGTSSPACGSGL